MVIDHLRAHGLQEFIKALRRGPLEKRVRLPAGAHAVDDLAAVPVLIHHPVHGVDVILPVAVDGDRDVAAVPGLHQPRENGALVSAVPALADPDAVRIFFRQLPDDVPCAVFAAVVHEQDPALGADLPLGAELFDLLKEHRRRDGQDLLLVVARDDDIQ